MTTIDKKKNIEAIYTLSPMQQGMLFHSLYNESGEYFEQFTCTITGDFDPDNFQKAINAVVQRHSALRTAFVWKKVAKMLQVVFKKIKVPFEIQDWQQFSYAEQEEKLQKLLEKDRQQNFNLTKAPLMRCFIFKCGGQSYKFYIGYSHLILDGWSFANVMKEVIFYYEKFVHNLPIDLPAALPFSTYIEWLQKQDSNKSKVFWKSLLGDYSSSVKLPADRAVPVSQRESYDKLTLDFSKTETEKLQELAQKAHVTMNTIVQAAWIVLNQRYTGEEDIVVGTTVSGRPPQIDDIENMVGLFINTLPLRIQLSSDKTVINLLQEILDQAINEREYEYSSLVDIQGWGQVPRDVPLFNSIVVFENFPNIFIFLVHA